MVAFAVSRFSWRFNLLLPDDLHGRQPAPAAGHHRAALPALPACRCPQPLSDNGKLLYDQYLGIILINVVFQLGFCIFVLSNYMKTLSRELTEAALADGASVWRIYWSVILPLCRPALAALATLEFTFIYNDFFWALLLMKTGDKRPITSALNNLQGQFFTDTNLLAAGALLAAIPTIIVYLVLQRQFISGLTLGSIEGLGGRSADADRRHRWQREGRPMGRPRPPRARPRRPQRRPRPRRQRARAVRR